MRDKLYFTLTLFWIVAFSVFATILLSIPLFALDIHWENLSKISGFSFNILMKNYGYLMRYLLNPFAGKLKMPDFPDSNSALIHFSEVKNLFLLVLIICILFAYFYWKFYKERISFLYKNEIKIAMILPILLTVVALLIGFDNFFIAFHKILFRDNTWLFNPETDPIINVLTDKFFMYCFVIFGVVYEGLLGTLYLEKVRNNEQNLFVDTNHEET
ncbi:MAG TPA: TIGR01906 family membrane protein [Lactovum miscens]|uniref:TIGR01906 family membrane protein n=1 Tax=Lactovum miscens TaxID=190387 RepID=UPI002EDB5125